MSVHAVAAFDLATVLRFSELALSALGEAREEIDALNVYPVPDGDTGSNMLATVKAAALVEYNAPDYVTYLKRVFAGAGAETIAAIEQWGREEAQHGRALGRWAEMADPSFKLEEAFARFRKGYTPAHINGVEETSVRGSRRGEMIARCVVESGTSSY